MATDDASTKTDRDGATRWQIDDAVIRLREWANDRVYGLPDPAGEIFVGSSPSCAIQLRDPAGLISRRHARLAPNGRGWKLYDLESKNGVARDGVKRASFALFPGVEIEIGGLRLVAESRRLIALRALVARYVGWSAERQESVDEALRTLRDCGAQRSTLVLCGDGDLTPIAKRLHHVTFGTDAPFVVFGTDTITGESVGARTVCISPGKLSTDLGKTLAKLRESDARTRLVVCVRNANEAGEVAKMLERTARITIPALTLRLDEIEQLIRETVTDVAADLGAPPIAVTMNDVSRLAALDYDSIAAIEYDMMRVVVLRTWGVSAGAARLHISRVSFWRWAKRRKLAT